MNGCLCREALARKSGCQKTATLIRRDNMRKNVDSYQDNILHTFPFIQNSIEMSTTSVPLGSTFPLPIVAPLDFLHFCDYEFQLRVGHGHDLLELIRVAIGLGTFLSRHHKQARGQHESERIGSSRQRARANLDHWVRQYRKNWKSLHQLQKQLDYSDFDG